MARELARFRLWLVAFSALLGCGGEELTGPRDEAKAACRLTLEAINRTIAPCQGRDDEPTQEQLEAFDMFCDSVVDERTNECVETALAAYEQCAVDFAEPVDCEPFCHDDGTCGPFCLYSCPDQRGDVYEINVTSGTSPRS